MSQLNKKFALIAASCRNNGIGINGKLPWNLKAEMSYFTRITSSSCDGKQNAVIMGRNTWNSIPIKYRPLPNRVNVVISKTLIEVPKPAHYLFHSLSDSIKALSLDESIDKIFIIGGESVYRDAIAMQECESIYLTRIDSHFECDTFFPQVDLHLFKEVTEDGVPTQEQQECGIRYKFHVYRRV